MGKKEYISKKGITIITLIIFIIVMIILTGTILITGLIGNNDIISNALFSKNKYNNEVLFEDIKMILIDNFEGDRCNLKNAKKEIEKLGVSVTEIDNYLRLEFDDETYVAFQNSVVEKLISVDEIFDPTGKKKGMLHVADFINYSVGNWTEEEYNNISTESRITITSGKPTTNYGFGGVSVGSKKDGNVYGNNGFTGWRLFDVTEDNIVLISAGCPEYYYSSIANNVASNSEYVLSGTRNYNLSAPRDWSMYLNDKYKENGKATSLSKGILEDWYKKYVATEEDKDKDLYSHNEYIQKVYNTAYGSMIDINNIYWAGMAVNGGSYNGKALLFFKPMAELGGIVMGYYPAGTYGVRILLYLPKDIVFSSGSVGDKTLTSNGKTYTNAIWEIY